MSRGDEYRSIARDCIAMGRPDLALAAQALAQQADREDAGMDLIQAAMRAAQPTTPKEPRA